MQSELKKEEMELDSRASQRQTMLKKRTQLLEKKEEMTRKIRDLGSLPQNAFERHSKESLKQACCRRNLVRCLCTFQTPSWSSFAPMLGTNPLSPFSLMLQLYKLLSQCNEKLKKYR